VKRVFLIARREWLEQVRQPTMLLVIGTLFILVGGLVELALLMLEQIAKNPASLARFQQSLPDAGVDPNTAIYALAHSCILAYNFLVFTQFLGITAVLSGHAILHDRQCGTFTFLLLAPVRRIELLAGKVIGAMGPSVVMYVAICGLYAVMATTFEVTSQSHAFLPPSPAWIVAFFLGGPLWAAFISSICVTLSCLVRDVRTAQQLVWFVVFFATLIGGFMLSYVLDAGVGVQIGVAAMGLAGTVGALVVGTQVISRDLSR
jgi:ABC-type transport system involved in multi-copper enzyme maturation permease subunit